MSSERIFASWIAFRPASMPMSRKERSHNSPNSVSPIPITATSRTRSSLPHQDLAAVLRVRRIVEELLVRNQFLDCRGGIAPYLRNLIRDDQIEPVGARAAAVPDSEDAVSSFCFFYDRAEARHDRAAMRSSPINRPAPPAEALYSRASPVSPWVVSELIARPYFINLDRVRPIVVWIAAVPALQANSKSAAVKSGAEPIASATMVADGLTAYGWDSEPT